MRSKITLSSSNGFVDIPVNYNYLIQSAIYRNLSKELASFLHDHGYVINNRKFTLFVFSRLQGYYEYLSKQRKIRFFNPIQLKISSPISRFTNDIAQMILNEGLYLNNELLKIDSIEVSSSEIKGNKIIVESLSPVVAYSTLTKGVGKKYTLYFQPNEKDFQRIVIENLQKKAQIIYGNDTAFEETVLIATGTYKKGITKYKDTIITGYSGKYILEGDKRLLQTAIDAGLGSKNSMGYGFIESI